MIMLMKTVTYHSSFDLVVCYSPALNENHIIVNDDDDNDDNTHGSNETTTGMFDDQEQMAS